MALEERLRKIDVMLFAVIISYTPIILIPIYNQVMIKGQVFGNDITQYILTARCLIKKEENIFEYPYPLTPLLYVIPVLVTEDPLALYVFGAFVSGLLMVSIVCIMYYLLKELTKTAIARIVSVLFFGTFPLTLDIIGWGGQSTLMAMPLGLSSIIFMVHYLTHSKTKFFVLSSLMLLLSILSEPYVSFYFLITQWILLLQRIKYHDLETLLKRAVFPALSTLFVVILALIVKRHDIVLSVPLAVYTVTNPSLLEELLSRLTFNYFPISLALITIVVAYLILKLTIKSQNLDDRIHTTVVASTAIAFLIQFLITPAQYADRGLFLGSIPLVIMLSKVIDFFTCNQQRCIKLLTSVVFLLALLPSGIGINIYYNSLSFYSLDKDIFSNNNISFIRNEGGNVLYISPNPWAFTMSYITEKDVYPTEQPVWFIKTSQINASILATTLAWGTRWIDAGEIKVVDATPIWAQPSPAIYIAKYPYYVELFRLSDGALPITFSPINNESIIWHESPFYAREIKSWNVNDSMFSVYKYDTLTIRKVVRVDDSGAINIALNYSFINSFPREIKLRLISLMLKDTKALIAFNNGTYVQVELLQSFKEPWIRCYYNTNIEAYTSSLNVEISAEFSEHDEWGLPEVIVALKPMSYVSNITLLLKIKINNVNLSLPHVVLEDSAISDSHINWIIIDKSVHPDIIQRFLRDPLFKKYEDLSKYTIFKVKD